MIISNQQIQAQIQSDRDGRNWGAAYRDLYAAITQQNVFPSGGVDGMGYEYDSPATDVDEAVWLWVKGAKDVNSGTGAFASYIRGYTELQYQIRTGTTLPPDALQSASDQIIQNFLETLIDTNNWTLPTLRQVGAADAGAAASDVFKSDASSTGASNYSPWAGTVLFTNLGDGSFFDNWVLTNGTSPNKQEPGTYDLIAAAEATARESTLGQALWTLVSQYETLSQTQQLGSATVTAENSAAQDFFEQTYGGGVSSIPIGATIFDPATSVLTPGTRFQAEVVASPRNITVAPENQVVVGGAKNDTFIVADAPGSVTLRYMVRVLDGGGGENTLKYITATDLKTSIQKLQHGAGSDSAYVSAPRWRLQIVDSNNPDASDYDFNFQHVSFGAGNDTVVLDGGMRLQDLTNPDGTPGLKSFDGGGGKNIIDLTGDPANLQVSIGMASAVSGGIPLTLTAQISETGDTTGSLLATNFQQFSLGSGDDKVQVNPNLSTSTKLFVNGGGGNNVFSVGGGVETLIGGAGSNTFEISDHVDAPTSDIIWGGGGTSTYYIDGAPTVYVYYMDHPAAAKLSALTPDIIKFEHSDITPIPTYTTHLKSAPQPNGNEIFIINPGANDRIFNNGVELLGSRIPDTIYTSDHYIRFDGSDDAGASNYLWSFNPPSIGAPGPNSTQPLGANDGNIGLYTGLTLVNFVIGDFGIDYSGPIGLQPDYKYYPDQGFLDWNQKRNIDIQTSDDAGSHLNSDNGSVMSGSGAVDYGIAADTPTSLISSQNGGQGAVVDFLGSTTPSTLAISGGGGSDGLGLILKDTATGQSVTVVDGLGAAATRVASIAFSDSETLSYASILQTLTTASSTQTKLYGDGDANVIDSQGLATYAQGNGGGDTFVYNPGYGALEINEVDQGSTPSNVLQLGSGISAAQLMVTADASGDLYLADGTLGDLVKLDNQLSGSVDGVQSVTFADGSSMTAAQLVALETAGTTGADMLYGSSGADLVDGRGAPTWSQDYEQGNGGGDTFVYNSGYGRLEINEIDKGSSPNNVLQLGPGIDAAQLRLTGDYSGNLYLSDGTWGDQIQLDGELNSHADGVQTVTCADGSSLTASQLIALETTGTTGADTLFGSPGADVLDGKGAPAGLFGDQAFGNGGGDIFVYQAGYGQLEINENDNSVLPHNVLQLGSGITAAEIIVTADYNGSLHIGDGTPGDQITLDVQLQSSSSGVQLVTFADGTSLTAAQLATLEMTGTSGADTLVGTIAADVLDGKGAPVGSQDYEQGFGGGDTFVFNAGYGQLEISEYEIGTNILQFGSGVAASQISVSADQATNLFIADGISGDLVKIDAYNDRGPAGVQGVSFADGFTLTTAQLEALATTGTAGADTLYAPTMGVVFDGKGAPTGSKDYEIGRGGRDTFVFNAGYGQLEIQENDYSPNPSNVLQLGPGITVSQLSVSADAHGTFYLTDGTSGDEIKLDGERYGGGVQTVLFADGSSLSAAQLSALVTPGGSPGDDALYGTSAAEIFDGKGAPVGTQDYESGGGGGDTFVFNSGYGQLEIMETDYSDQPSNTLLFGPGITASQLTVTIDRFGINQSGTLLLKDGVSGDLVKLDDQQSGSSYGVQTVQFADGTSLSAAQLAALALTGTPDADSIIGTSGADMLDGKGAPAGSQDYIQGNGGGDTFVYNAGYGQLAISEFDFSGSTDVLQLGGGLTLSQVTVSADSSSNLYLTDGIAGDQIEIYYGAAKAPYFGIGMVQFADGTTMTKADLLALAGGKTGTTEADFLYGGGEANTFDGKGAPSGSQDYESGGGGGDTFIFNAGYGQLEVNELEYSWGPASNALQFGPGINALQLVVSADASGNLDVTDGIAGDRIQIDGQLDDIIAGGSHGVQSFMFADGSSLTLSQLTIPVTGTTGADSLHAGLGKDVFDGSRAPVGSQDYEQGNGSATFVFSAGYGQLEVNDDAGFYNNTSAVLQLGSGITPGQVSITTDYSGNIVVTDGVANDQIQIDAMNTQGYGGYSQFGVGSIQFADGTVWSSGQILSLAAKGTMGSDTIAGTTSDDVLDGRGGTDIISGAGGNDSYLFSSGYGSLTIDNTDSNGTSAQGQIDLGQGLTEQSLWFEQTSSDLLITHLGSMDTIDVAGWFGLDPSAQIATIKSADGLQSGASDVGQLVSAMAVYASANPSFSPTTASSMPTDPTLQSAINTYWHA